MTITKLVIRYDLNPGLSDYRESQEWENEFPAHRAALALALDTRDEKRMGLRGAYGDATCHLYAVDTSGAGRLVETEDDYYDDDNNAITERDLIAAIPDGGTIDTHDVFALYGPVWNGNNHVEFVPARAIDYLSDDDRTRRDGHALVCYYSDGSSDVTVDVGWDWLDDTSDEMLQALDNAGVEWEELDLGYEDRQIIVNIEQFEEFERQNAMADDVTE